MYKVFAKEDIGLDRLYLAEFRYLPHAENYCQWLRTSCEDTHLRESMVVDIFDTESATHIEY